MTMWGEVGEDGLEKDSHIISMNNGVNNQNGAHSSQLKLSAKTSLTLTVESEKLSSHFFNFFF